MGLRGAFVFRKKGKKCFSERPLSLVGHLLSNEIWGGRIHRLQRQNFRHPKLGKGATAIRGRTLLNWLASKPKGSQLYYLEKTSMAGNGLPYVSICERGKRGGASLRKIQEEGLWGSGDLVESKGLAIEMAERVG